MTNNFRSQFVLQQPIFIGGKNFLGLDGARIGADMAHEGRKLADMQVIFETLTDLLRRSGECGEPERHCKSGGQRPGGFESSAGALSTPGW